MPLNPHLPPLSGITITAGVVTSRYFIKNSSLLTQAVLESVVLNNPTVALDNKHKIIYVREVNPRQVSVISAVVADMSLHSLAWWAKVFSTALVGRIFQSPTPGQIEVAMIDRVDGTKGIVAIVMNHQGDLQNFKTAIRRAKETGLHVELVTVGDDVCVGRENSMKGGFWSGIAGTVLVGKIATALVTSGATLEEISRVARLTAQNVVSVGISLSNPHIPNHPLPSAQTDEFLATEQIYPCGSLVMRHVIPRAHIVEVDLPSIVKEMLRQLLDWRETRTGLS